MSLTIVLVADSYDVFGGTPYVEAVVSFDNSYPAGGYAITGQLFGLRNIGAMWQVGCNTSALGQSYIYNRTTQKLMVLMSAAAPLAFADLTPATDISLNNVRFGILQQR